MQILSNIFYILLYVSVIGSLFTIVLLFVNHILRCRLPLWFSVCVMLLYVLPLLAPEVRLVSPDAQVWAKGFYVACVIWAGGAAVLLFCSVLRSMAAGRAMKHYRLCDNEQINEICSRCVRNLGMKKRPVLYFGTLEHPACVAGILRPAIILQESILTQLNEKELQAVFFHELTHMRRRHLLMERIYAYVCILNWFNPFVWIARENFSLHCETDCDYSALAAAAGEMTETEYACAMIRLLELSTVKSARPGQGIGALDFLLTKRRIQAIMTRTSKVKSGIVAAVLTVLLLLVIVFSMWFSRQHFYPYPAYDTGTEYAGWQ